MNSERFCIGHSSPFAFSIRVCDVRAPATIDLNAKLTLSSILLVIRLPKRGDRSHLPSRANELIAEAPL